MRVVTMYYNIHCTTYLVMEKDKALRGLSEIKRIISHELMIFNYYLEGNYNQET